MKKNILIIDSFTGMGGEEEVAYYLYENIDRKKYNVKIMAPKDSRYFEKKSPKNEELIDGKVTGKYDFVSMLKFRNIIKKHKIDLIHVHGYSAGYFVRLACGGLKSIKVIWTMHLNILDVHVLSRTNRLIKAKVDNLLCNSKIFTDRIICVSNEAKIALKKRGVSRIPISVIYNGIDATKFTDEKHDFSVEAFSYKRLLRIGFISRLSPQKNIPLLLKIAKTLKEKKYYFRLLIVGEGELYDFAKDYINNNNLSDVVELIGFRKDIDSILQNIDILLLPSLYECFPMIILESLSSGVPVIASNVNGIPEIIRDGINGYLAKSGEVESFVEKINILYENPHLIYTMGKNGSDIVNRKYTKEIMLKQHEEIYSEVLKNE